MFPGETKGEPERREGPREQEAPTRPKPLGATSGVRLFEWEETVGAPARGLEVSWGSAGTERGEVKTFFRPFRRRKALKGEAHER